MKRRGFLGTALRTTLSIAGGLFARLAEAQEQHVDFARLPLDRAIRIAHGSRPEGALRRLVAFEDPYCPFCRRLEHTLASLDDITVYVMLFPILTPQSRTLSDAIWCAPDRAAAWRDWMLNGQPPASVHACANSPVDANLALATQLGVRITPSMVFPSGELVTGALPLDDIEGILERTRR